MTGPITSVDPKQLSAGAQPGRNGVTYTIETAARNALIPVGLYGVDTGPGGGSVLYRFVPLVPRPRAALAVPLALADTRIR